MAGDRAGSGPQAAEGERQWEAGSGAAANRRHDEGLKELGASRLVTPQGQGLVGGCRLGSLYVGNLAHETTEADLRTAFSQFGTVVSARIVSGRRGRPKGFAYVEMADDASAEAAMESLRGTQINGRTMDIVPEEPRRGGRARRSGGRRRR